MGRLSDAWRAQILSTFSGSTDGRPEWVKRMELGEDEGYFGPGSAAWAVHGGLPTMVAGIRALLMQTLHPGAMAGVHDWSRYKEDSLGRLAGTVQWLVTVTFADTVRAQEESARVSSYHRRVRGSYLDASGLQLDYSASDPELLSWVHVVFTDAFLGCHLLWGGPIPGGADAYVREWAQAGILVGVQEPPRSVLELRRQLGSFDGALRSEERVAEAVRFIRNPPLRPALRPAYRVLFAGAVASLPEQYRRLLGLRDPGALAIWATGVVLRTLGRMLRGPSPSQEAAMRRVERLRAADTPAL